MGTTTGDAGLRLSVNIAVDLENPATRSDIDVENLAVAPHLHLVLDHAVIQIPLRPEQLALREPILDRRGDRTWKLVDRHSLLEGDRGDRTRKPVDRHILPSPRGHLEGDRDDQGRGDP
jgi:hypothetical protein